MMRVSIYSVHEQIRFPSIVNASDEVTDEHDMVWTDRLPQQIHHRFSGQTIPLFVIAANARRHEIFPTVFAAASARDHMIDRERNIYTATILTAMTIAPKDVLPRQNNLFEGYSDVDREANDARERHRHRNRMQEPAVSGFDQLGFPQKQKNDSFLDVTDAQGLVVVIQNEHFPVQLSCGVNCKICCAEVLSTSLRRQIWALGEQLLEG